MRNKIILIVLFIACNFSVFAETDLSGIRPAIKIYIDELYNSVIISIEHTTCNSIAMVEKRLPDTPKIFNAGRYKVVFIKDANKKAMIFQTEEKVGHIALIIPGRTVIGGFVEILREPESIRNTDITHTAKSTELQNTFNSINDLKLNEVELDYLIQILYKNFGKPLTDIQSTYLNNAKDYALAIKFSGKKGIVEYHNKLIKKLGAKSFWNGYK